MSVAVKTFLGHRFYAHRILSKVNSVRRYHYVLAPQHHYRYFLGDPVHRLPLRVACPAPLQSWSRHLSSKSDKDDDHNDEPKPAEKKSVVKRFKQMFKDYWYVLVPVHCVTSVVWYGGFYVMCKSGVDVPSILAYFGTSEAYLEKLRTSNLGYYALAYACYKIATPARYTVTVGGTTLSVKYLTEWGVLKTSSQVADNIREKTDIMKDRVKDEWEDSWMKYAKRKPPKFRSKSDETK